MTLETNATRSLALLAAEVAAFTAVFLADQHGMVPLSKTPFLVLVAWASLRLRGRRWRDAGLAGPTSGAWRPLAIGMAAGTAFWAFEFFVENPVLRALTGRYPDLSDFRDIVGSLPMLDCSSG